MGSNVPMGFDQLENQNKKGLMELSEVHRKFLYRKDNNVTYLRPFMYKKKRQTCEGHAHLKIPKKNIFLFSNKGREVFCSTVVFSVVRISLLFFIFCINFLTHINISVCYFIALGTYLVDGDMDGLQKGKEILNFLFYTQLIFAGAFMVSQLLKRTIISLNL